MSSRYNYIKSLHLERETLKDKNKRKEKHLKKLLDNKSTSNKHKLRNDLQVEITNNKSRISKISRLIQGKLLYWLTLTHLFTQRLILTFMPCHYPTDVSKAASNRPLDKAATNASSSAAKDHCANPFATNASSSAAKDRANPFATNASSSAAKDANGDEQANVGTSHSHPVSLPAGLCFYQ